MKKRTVYILAVSLVMFISCEKDHNTDDKVTYGDNYMSIDLSTDKAVYKPGETVRFTLKEKLSGTLEIRYSYLGHALSEEALTSTSWSWTPPAGDFKGYMVDIYETVNGKDTIYQNIAVDVSSDWNKFPRYGFLSAYGNISSSEIENTVNMLNRYHINGIQFYDWLYDHQRPLAGTAQNPASSWVDISGRTNYMSTTKQYIDKIHSMGMNALFYDLCYGALNNAVADGVQEEWYIFKDTEHSQKDVFNLSSPFRSSIYLTNPSNPDWQKYLTGRVNDVYSVYDFDGYHIDQLGDRGMVYDYGGNSVALDQTFKPFIDVVKADNPAKKLLFNAVNQYGQAGAAQSGVDFLYTEVWDPNNTFEQLAQVILDNNTYSSNTKNTVLAAYINYAKSNSSGYMNAPGVLLANAVIFAFGGAHIELGEHYLANEYYPNSNLQMKSDLKLYLVHYYDFLVAYQNLLRDGGTFTSYTVESLDGKLSTGNWSQGKVSVAGKKFADKDVIHLINFSNANDMEWRDTNGTQAEPATITDAKIKITANASVKSCWFASPDVNGGVAQTVGFSQAGNDVTLSIPSLKYWDMIVLEY
ncbi:MAG: glycoside hydrolase family 66 protein [Oscillospiraceae bacterium]|nr:glycoside hydrolase family 66 protein [Oscillospiraceae bacterium]